MEIVASMLMLVAMAGPAGAAGFERPAPGMSCKAGRLVDAPDGLRYACVNGAWRILQVGRDCDQAYQSLGREGATERPMLCQNGRWEVISADQLAPSGQSK